LMARTLATLAVIIGFFIYIYAANVYVAQTYFNRGKSAGTAVPFTQQIQQITQTITQYMQIAVIAFLALVTVNIVLKSRKILGVIPFKDVQRHLMLLGPTGSGKTTIAKDIIRRAVGKGVKITVIDWKGEYVDYIRGATVIRKTNLWDVGGRNSTERALIAIEIIREVTRDIAEISSVSSTLLLRELVKLYREKQKPTTKDVVERVDRFMQTALTERRLAEANMAAAILRRLYWLVLDEERPDENVYGNPAVTVYDLSSTGSNYLKTLYSLAILSRKYYEALKVGPNNKLIEVLIAEECQNYVRGRRFDDPPSIGERIVNELRTYGVGVVLVCPDSIQIPWHMARDVGGLVGMGSQALPDFLEQMRYRYTRKGMMTVGKTNSTFVYHRSKLTTVRFKPRPPRPIRLKAVEAPIGAWQPLGR
jgi:GTPase SAR1 family protein